MSRDYNRQRAFCNLLRSLRSAGLALSIVWLPTVAQFVRGGRFGKPELGDLARDLAVAALMVLFNFLQRLREKELRPRRRRKRQE